MCVQEENTTTINTQCGDGALLPKRVSVWSRELAVASYILVLQFNVHACVDICAYT